jgi:hypothetical protein
MAYDYNTHGTKVALGDLNADGILEIITGPGGGEACAPWVKIWNSDGTLYNPGAQTDFMAYGVSKYGVNVAPCTVDGDPFPELLTGPGPGNVFGPHVRGWDLNGSQATPMNAISFIAYGTRKWGVNVAGGDVDDDGYSEIITGPGPGNVFGPHVRGWNFDGGTLTAMQDISYFAYGTRKWGSNVATADVDGDGFDEILTGPGPGPDFGPHVRGWNYDGVLITSINNISYFAYGTGKWGVNVNGGDFDGDGYGEIVTGPGPSDLFAPDVKSWNYDNTQIVQLGFWRAWSQFQYGANIATGPGFGY